MKRVQVGVALSGGVDSTSTAMMLSEDYTVTGFFMQLAQPDVAEQIENVSSIAAKINIPLVVVDLRKQFEEKVLEYFRKSYFGGTTPNPCMICNRSIKFGLFLDEILKHGMDKAATGHYARVYKEQGTYHLAKGRDTRKDQSYFLARLCQSQLSSVLFPLGMKTKEEMFSYTEDRGLPSFRGSESQDVCFLKDTTVQQFLASSCFPQTGEGEIVDTRGTVLGRHSGIHNYTIGQRRGLNISAPTPLYVIRLDAGRNQVVVGADEELYSREIHLTNLHWLCGHPAEAGRRFSVKIRYTHSGSQATLTARSDDGATLVFDEPQRAITPGQFGVLYDGDEVVGSGVIE